MNNISNLAFDLTEQGLVPDTVIRRGIRHLIKQRLKEIYCHDTQKAADEFNEFLLHLKVSPIALLPEKANEQHYEVPAEFFEHVLGPYCKYSCAFWPEEEIHLENAEYSALEKTCTNARLSDGQNILELGCGWGSLSLWMAAAYPNSLITAVSNSYSQRAFIEQRAIRRGLKNLNVVTSDMNDFNSDPEVYDRIVSVEMFEHMRNWHELYSRISNWLKPGGLFFKHIFVHRGLPYFFEDNGPSDWMSRHFFSGGMMPSDDLPLAFQHDLMFLKRWRWDGTHYEKTANAWLRRMDQNRDDLWSLFLEVYGTDNAEAWWNRWRIFFMACAELFGYDSGQQWWISHYLFEKSSPKHQVVIA
ncbi:MAG: class I SAM-dependent methyltransferase [Gammaproteobacteria bacterium]|nr:MAG: class I SAM-dependent methyltransferase [Gammaproteobacteria bacterium]